MRGRSLHDVLHDPGTGIAQAAVLPLDPSRVALIARAILTVLSAGRVHGYINPHTILLTDDGNALLVGDRVAIGATPANDVYALGTTLFEAVEGYAPHPAEPVPAPTKAGMLTPLIEAMTRRDPAERPDAGWALEMLEEIVAAAANAAAGSGTDSADAADAAETTTILPQVESSTGHEGGGATAGGGSAAGGSAADGSTAGDLAGGGTAESATAGGSGSGMTGAGGAGVGGVGAGASAGGVGGGAGEGGAGVGSGGGGGAGVGDVGDVGDVGGGDRASDDTSLLPPVPAGPPEPPGPPTYDVPAYRDIPAYAPEPRSKRKVLVIGSAVAAVVLTGGVALGVTQPWHRTDNSVSTVPGVPLATATPTAPAGAPSSTPTPTTSTPTPTPTMDPPTGLVSMTLCLDAAGGAKGVQTGAEVTAAACHGSPNQKWQIHTDGTVHNMADQNLCLDAAAPNGQVANGAQVTAWTCHGGPNQDWVWNADGTASPVANKGLCLDAAGPVPIHAGAKVTAWPCNGGPNEKWAKQ